MPAIKKPAPVKGVLPKSLKVNQPPAPAKTPLWKGPMDDGPLGGISQSMLGRFLVCRERFRINYVEGLAPIPKFNAPIEVGNMWHVCEEHIQQWEPALLDYGKKCAARYPSDQEEVDKWYRWVKVVFPEYLKYWSAHKDVQHRTPLLPEYVFHVPYTLPSGRVVYLRGKFDSVDLIGSPTSRNARIYLQENKTKSELNQQAITQQLRFDLQTMFYLVALVHECKERAAGGDYLYNTPIAGVRYNCILRSLPIRRHKEKVTTKGKVTPAESIDAYYTRLLDDYVRAEPQNWFQRWQVEINEQDVTTFRTKCLDPILEQLCDWWDHINYQKSDPFKLQPVDEDENRRLNLPYGLHWVHPYGVYNVLNEGGTAEIDDHLFNGTMAGLREVKTLFEELQ